MKELIFFDQLELCNERTWGLDKSENSLDEAEKYHDQVDNFFCHNLVRLLFFLKKGVIITQDSIHYQGVICKSKECSENLSK